MKNIQLSADAVSRMQRFGLSCDIITETMKILL